MSGKDQLCRDNQSIDDMNACKKAATFLGKQFKESINRRIFPKGCYLILFNDNVYFNTHSNGRKSNDAEQICKVEPLKGMYVCVPNFKNSSTI